MGIIQQEQRVLDTGEAGALAASEHQHVQDRHAASVLEAAIETNNLLIIKYFMGFVARYEALPI
jgi:hypothetical protein